MNFREIRTIETIPKKNAKMTKEYIFKLYWLKKIRATIRKKPSIYSSLFFILFNK